MKIMISYHIYYNSVVKTCRNHQSTELQSLFCDYYYIIKQKLLKMFEYLNKNTS